MIRDEPVGDFVDLVASDAPTPGGGSVAAVAAAVGAALVAMVARLTAGRAGFEEVAARMGEIRAAADGARAEFLTLADRDAESFDAVMAAFRLAKGTDDERAARTAAIQAAFSGAAAVPLDVAERSARLMDLALEVVQVGNPDAGSDGLSGAAMLHAAVSCAVANVEINAAALKDADEAARLRASAEALSALAGERLDETRRAFEERAR